MRGDLTPRDYCFPVNDKLRDTVGKLTAEYVKVGGELNQIARSLNEYGNPNQEPENEVRETAADLSALKEVINIFGGQPSDRGLP